MIEKIKLLPCPFCGKPGHISFAGDGIGKTFKTPYVYYPTCNDSHCLGRNTRKHYPSREEAARVWNTRF